MCTKIERDMRRIYQKQSDTDFNFQATLIASSRSFHKILGAQPKLIIVTCAEKEISTC